MTFLVRGHDGTDPDAPARRQAARADHLAFLDTGKETGHLLFAVATRDGDRVTGSTVIYDVESREELDLLLAQEPYVKAGVWVSVDIEACGVAPQFKRP